MTQPTLGGRLLPRQDWEGDDFTPGAHGEFVTCQDTAAGRMLAYATNGEFDIDGKVIRANIRPQDSNGVSLGQVADSIARLTTPPRILRWGNKTVQETRAWLAQGLGLVIDGWYGAIPRRSRFQAGAQFGHAIWFSDYSASAGYRRWDPLNRDLNSFGEYAPAADIEPFIRSFSGLCGWIALEPITIPVPPVEVDPVKFISFMGDADALPSVNVSHGTPILDLEGHQWDTISTDTSLRKVGNGDAHSTTPAVIVQTARYYGDGVSRPTVQLVKL